MSYITYPGTLVRNYNTDISTITQIIASETRIPVGDIINSTRRTKDREVVEARMIGVYVSKKFLGYSYTGVRKFFNINSNQTIRNSLVRVEELTTHNRQFLEKYIHILNRIERVLTKPKR